MNEQTTNNKNVINYNPKILEKRLELELCAGVRALGGMAMKFNPLALKGAPDRLMIYPGGVVEFVELKTSTGRLSEAQTAFIARLSRLGVRVFTLRGREEVRGYLKRARELYGNPPRTKTEG